MKEQINLMNKYVADLSVLNVKLHNLHWNVIGENFEAAHVYLEKLYTDLFEKYDEAAERIKMLGEFPEASVKKYLEMTSIVELSNKDYTVEEAYQVALDEYANLKQTASKLRKLADSNDDFITVSLTEDHITIFDKEIWFIKSALK